MLGSGSEVFIRQRKEWVEILVDWETKNQYEILDAEGNELGSVVEKAGGLFDAMRRGFLRSHRPLEIGVFDRTRAQVLSRSSGTCPGRKASPNGRSSRILRVPRLF